MTSRTSGTTGKTRNKDKRELEKAPFFNGLKMKRSIFLKYISILIMLTALVRVFFGFMMINFFAQAKNMGISSGGLMHSAGIALLLIVLCAIGELICGFRGALSWEEPLLAGKCLKWGVVTLILGLLGNLFQWLSGYGVSCVAWITGALVPGAYTLAAFLFYRKQNSSD